MPRVNQCYPDGTKYVVEAHGSIVKRYVEYPDGRRIRLSNRKSHRCTWGETAASIVPDQVNETPQLVAGED
jgi:hypothetical protein